MRKKNFKGRCEKRILSKCERLFKSYDPIQNAYADILEAIIELVKAIKESKNDVKEEVVKPEDEEPETYIIKQATTKVDKKIEKGTEKKKYFDMLGRKL